jgi:UDP-N-acetylglucosamine 2-epimerase (non-hydrolysing)
VNILSVVGARPNFVKIAPIVAEIARHPELTGRLVHTGQHFDDAMSDAFFRDLDLPAPDLHLGVGGGTHAEQTARTMLALDAILETDRPDWVVVVGDVNATLAATVTAVKRGIRVAHVEAGLRSFNRRMPEELNRVLTDAVADLLLTPSADADENLLREGIAPERIRRVGNVMIDTLRRQLPRAAERRVLEQFELETGGFAVVTLHRPSNVDHRETLAALLNALGELARILPVVFPVHPRTAARLAEFRLAVPNGVRTTTPLGYLDFLKLWSESRLVLTDSGGLQEETTALGVPCLTLRDETERPVTVTQGTNRVVGNRPDRILAAVVDILNGKHPDGRIPDLWDGNTAPRIVQALLTPCPPRR